MIGTRNRSCHLTPPSQCGHHQKQNQRKGNRKPKTETRKTDILSIRESTMFMENENNKSYEEKDGDKRLYTVCSHDNVNKGDNKTI